MCCFLDTHPTYTPIIHSGFRFLVMEKMNGTLHDVIPQLLAGKRTRGNKIPFGNVGARLLDCIEALHETGFLFVDVKPENFMLSRNDKTLADSIRMLDFGLIQSVKGISGHRPNEGTSSLVGTPLYSSLNVHDGQTHSRRDDLEALGYIVGELLVKLIVAANGGDDSKVQLPWSDGTSDEHIYKLKQKDITSTNSTFFNQMGMYGNDALEQAMRNYFSTVRAMNYKEKPDYEALRKLLLSLDVVVAAKPNKKKPAASRKKAVSPGLKKAAASTLSSATRKSTTRRASAKRSSAQSDDEEEDSPPKIRRLSKTKDDGDEYDDCDMRDRTYSGDTDFVTAHDETEDMDWEAIDDDDGGVQMSTSPSSRLGIKILFTKGPHEGECFTLIKKDTEIVYLGSNPTAKDGDGFALSGDDQVDDTHVKFVLSANKRLQTVLVTDLKSSSGTYVNGTAIPARKEQKVFINDTITIGDSTMKVVKLAAHEDKKPAAKPAAAAAKKPAAVRATKDEENEEPARNKAPSSKVGVRITITEGPCEDESFTLTKDDAHLVIGSNPSSKSSDDEAIVVPDPSMDATHARLELDYARKFCTINVTDCKSSSGTFLNASRIPSGKSRKAFINDTIKMGDTVMQIKTLK